MLQLIKFDLLVKALVITTIVISTLIYYLIQYFFLPDYPFYKVVPIASVVTALLVVIILSPICYRRGWRLLRLLGNSRFQDLNGAWAGTINPSTGGALAVRAVIRQSLLGTEIDLHGESVKSITLTASVILEAGQYKLYYVFRAEPRNPAWAPYNGTTKFNLRNIASDAQGLLALSGHYYTDRETMGTIQLSQTNYDPTTDVSFY
ncbi:hypothetical protein ACVIGB_008959 [Bradyrhizobium sp. USDA 4341]